MAGRARFSGPPAPTSIVSVVPAADGVLITFNRSITSTGEITTDLVCDTDGGPESPSGTGDLTSATTLFFAVDDALTVGGAWAVTVIPGIATTNGGTFTLPASGTIGAG